MTNADELLTSATVDANPKVPPRSIPRAGSSLAGNGDRPSEDGGTEDYYRLSPTDFEALLADGIPEIPYLDAPYVPRGARVWLWGPTGTAKSIWALWLAVRLSKAGTRVAYFSEENPTAEDLRRIGKLQATRHCFDWYHRTGMDLNDPRWVEAMLQNTAGCELVVFDTFTDLWGGDENSNAEIRDFDKNVLKPLQAQGATIVIVHHTGHPAMFSNRRGATAGRGGSALGQKADVALDFKGESDGAFTIIYGKARIGGERQPDRTFRVIDTDDDGLDIIETAGAHDRAVAELVEKCVQAIVTAPAGFLTTSELRAAVGGSSKNQGEAFALLELDDRVQVRVEKVPTKNGSQRDSKVWRPGKGGRP